MRASGSCLRKFPQPRWHEIGVAWPDARGVSIPLRLSRLSLRRGHQPRTHLLGKDPMSNVPLSSDAAVRARAMPSMTWNGAMVSSAETQTHYLHLTAFPCANCNGPVIVGSLGTRRDDISKETDIRRIGSACIACGSRPESVLEPSVEHRFRPVEWKWAINVHRQKAESTDHAAELAQDTDTKP